MRILVGGAVVVLAFALAFIIWNFNLDVLVEAFLSQPTPQKVAWIATVAASLLLLGLALWQSEMLLRQRKIAQNVGASTPWRRANCRPARGGTI